MNMWGPTPEFIQTLEDGFKEFFANMGDNDILKAEYLLPIYIDELLQAGRVFVKVLDTNDKWFGVERMIIQFISLCFCNFEIRKICFLLYFPFLSLIRDRKSVV